MRRGLRPILLVLIPVVALLGLTHLTTAEEIPTSQQARDALRRGVHYFRTKVSIEGGYLWRYSADFSEREGEVPASPTTAWVQPPGTPTIGDAYLEVFELTGDRYYLDAARETAHALVRGQLQSGGWDYRIEFAPKDRRKHAYRADSAVESNGQKRRNRTTLDDNTTQAALRFLMRIDRALGFQDQKVHASAEYALAKLLEAQYPNGAWPQRFSTPPNPADYPVKRASYPPTWSRKHPKQDYRDYYTFNDNTIADMIDVMFLAAEIYDAPQYRAAAEKGGDFILLAQMPDPQPGWAQQYNAQMHPAWARRFEPPAITGGESQGVMRTLLRLYERTGKQKYLEPLPRALAYFRSSVLPDGRLARFYELKTNKPLYFTKDYQLTYSDADMPTHYGFKTSDRLNRIEKELKQLQQSGPSLDASSTRARRPPRLTAALSKKVRRIIEAQNEEGAWAEPAPDRKRSRIAQQTPTLDCRTFARNIVTLGRFLAASKAAH